VATTKTGMRTNGQLYLGASARTDLIDDPAFVNAFKIYKFDSVTPQDVLTYPVIEPQRGTYDFSGADKLVHWAAANNIRIRGHSLLAYENYPSWLAGSTREEALAAAKAHIQTEVGRYKGKVAQWDVVNEALATDGGLRQDNLWREKLGDDFVALAFQWAHEADPSAQLYYNEYQIESDGRYPEKWQSLLEMINDFKARGIPIDGIGFQCHSQFNMLGTGPEILTNVMKIGELGLHVEMTEVDVRDMPGEAAHTGRFAEMGRACKDSNGICTGLTTAGLYDGAAYVPPGTNPVTLDDNLQPKPSYFALMEAMGLPPGP
jgi:endo-1,4-beta-xylanase